MIIVRSYTKETVDSNQTDLNIHFENNENEKGFASNHNLNFQLFSSKYFVVLNPDIRISGRDVFSDLADYSAEVKDQYILSPIIKSSTGKIEDFARPFPTISQFIKRLSQKLNYGKPQLEYNTPTNVDWTAGMFHFFPSKIYQLLGGYDERYFLYCEDVDICLRAKFLSIQTRIFPKVSVVHNAQRASRKSFRYFLIHLKSYCRLWKKIYGHKLIKLRRTYDFISKIISRYNHM